MTSLEKATVLVVDDDIVNIDILSEILEPTYKVKVATNGEKALKVAASDTPPDLILLDVLMPGMNGFEVCKVLKSMTKTKDIPVIFVTSKSEEVDEAKGFEVGAVDYITKPITPAIVHARVSTQLSLADQKHLLKQLVKERTNKLFQTRLELINVLSVASEYKDTDTGLHVLRIGHYSKALAHALGLGFDDQEYLFQAAPMHDVGKIGIPDGILQKQGKLDDTEWEIMIKHPEIGMKILGTDQSSLMKAAREIAISHHEKWNGAGYPNKLEGENIPLFGRIVAIVDVFDALTMERPYKKAWDVNAAFDLINEEKGNHFDPKLAELFLQKREEILQIQKHFNNENSNLNQFKFNY